MRVRPGSIEEAAIALVQTTSPWLPSDEGCFYCHGQNHTEACPWQRLYGAVVQYLVTQTIKKEHRKRVEEQKTNA